MDGSMDMLHNPLLRRNQTGAGPGLKMLNGFLYFLIIFGQITAFDFVTAFKIAGFSPASYSGYLIYAFAVLSMFMCLFILRGKAHRLLLLAVIFYIAYLMLLGVQKTGDIENVIYESKNYVSFVALYFYVLWAKPSIKGYVYALYATLPFLAVASVLTSLGIMKGMQSGTGDLLRGAGNADGITGVVGALIAFYYILNPEDGIRPKYSIVAFVCAIVTVGVGMSRGRVGILLLTLFVLFVSLNRKNPKILKRVLAVMAVVVLLVLIFSSYAFQIIEQVTRRFDTLTDRNMIVRGDEVNYNLAVWKLSPLTGQGFGLMRRYYTSDHNSYVGLLMSTGIIGCGLFVGWFLTIFVDSRKKFRRFLAPNRFQLVAVIMLAIAFLAYGNMGFKKMGSVLGMLYVYIAIASPPSIEKAEQIKEKMDASTII